MTINLRKKLKETQMKDFCYVNWGNTNITKASYVPNGYPAFSASGQDGFLDKYEFDRDAIILSAIGARCGRIFFAINKWTAIKNTIVIYPEDNNNCKFLFYYLSDEKKFPKRGGAQPFISMGDVRKIKVLLPSLTEQKEIAEILSKVDEDIEKTDKIIRQTKNLKKGLVKELLVKGEERRIKDVANINPQQINPLNTPEANFNYIDIASVKNNVITEVKKIIGKNAPSRARRLIKTGDIIISTVRPNLKGYTYITENYSNSLCSTGFCVLRGATNKVDSKFLYYVISNDGFTEYLIGKTTGSNYPAVNPNDIKDYIFFLPDIDEQKNIGMVLSKIDEKIDIYDGIKLKLELLKKGLMQDLLNN